MADTILGSFQEPCDDCGGSNSIYRHWGSLTNNNVMTLCFECWEARRKYYYKHGVAYSTSESSKVPSEISSKKPTEVSNA